MDSMGFDLVSTLTNFSTLDLAIIGSAIIACVLVPRAILRARTLRQISAVREQILDYDRRAKVIEKLLLGYANSFNSLRFKELEELIRTLYKLKRDVDLSQDLLHRGQRGPAVKVLRKCTNLTGYIIREDSEIPHYRFDIFCERRIQQLGECIKEVYDGLNRVGISPSVRGENILGKLEEAGVSQETLSPEFNFQKAA